MNYWNNIVISNAVWSLTIVALYLSKNVYVLENRARVSILM